MADTGLSVSFAAPSAAVLTPALWLVASYVKSHHSPRSTAWPSLPKGSGRGNREQLPGSIPSARADPAHSLLCLFLTCFVPSCADLCSELLPTIPDVPVTRQMQTWCSPPQPQCFVSRRGREHAASQTVYAWSLKLCVQAVFIE